MNSHHIHSAYSYGSLLFQDHITILISIYIYKKLGLNALGMNNFAILASPTHHSLLLSLFSSTVHYFYWILILIYLFSFIKISSKSILHSNFSHNDNVLKYFNNIVMITTPHWSWVSLCFGKLSNSLISHLPLFCL